MKPNANYNKDDHSLSPTLEGAPLNLKSNDDTHDTTLGTVDSTTESSIQQNQQVGTNEATTDPAFVASTSSITMGPTQMAPPSVSTIPSKKDTTTSEDQKTCRICGEGEQDEQDDSTHGDYDEESVLNAPLRSTLHLTPTTPLMTTRHNTSWDGRASYEPRQTTKQWIQQKNPLIRPCRCKGTMMYVHVSCLNRWRTLSPRASSYVACDLCKYEYNIYRPRYAAIVTNLHFLRLMTAFLVMISILACAYLCKLVDVYLLGHLPDPDNHDWVDLHGTTWLWMDRFYLVAGLIVISLLGMVYLTFLCVTMPLDDSSRQDVWFCCDQTSCPWYSCYLADVAACSGDAAAGGFLVFIVLMSLLAILFGILGAITGVYRWMEVCVDRIAGHVKERILDV
ncbi:hypothetical protein BC941DRAFT_415910, partial [Chlamydoabsidia padenii]